MTDDSIDLGVSPIKIVNKKQTSCRQVSICYIKRRVAIRLNYVGVLPSQLQQTGVSPYIIEETKRRVAIIFYQIISQTRLRNQFSGKRNKLYFCQCLKSVCKRRTEFLSCFHVYSIKLKLTAGYKRLLITLHSFRVVFRGISFNSAIKFRSMAMVKVY